MRVMRSSSSSAKAASFFFRVLMVRNLCMVKSFPVQAYPSLAEEYGKARVEKNRGNDEEREQQAQQKPGNRHEDVEYPLGRFGADHLERHLVIIPCASAAARNPVKKILGYLGGQIFAPAASRLVSFHQSFTASSLNSSGSPMITEQGGGAMIPLGSSGKG